MRTIAFMSFLFVAALMTGCFHDNDDSSSPPVEDIVIVEDQSAAGIYLSIASMFVSEAIEYPAQNPVNVIIANTGEARFLFFGSTGTPLMYTQLVGKVNVAADKLTASLKEYSDGNAQTSTVDLDGTIVTKDGAWGSYTWDQDFGRFVLNYVSTYEEPSELNKLQGIWTFSQASSSGLTFTLTLTIDPDGTVFGSNTEGCVYNGKFKIIDAQFNVYRLLLETSLCGDLDGAYKGLASLFEFESLPPRKLMFGLTNQDHSLSGMVFSSLQT
jgi:hypothetical protein